MSDCNCHSCRVGISLQPTRKLASLLVQFYIDKQQKFVPAISKFNKSFAATEIPVKYPNHFFNRQIHKNP